MAIGLAQLGPAKLNDGCQVVIQTMIEPIMQRSQEQQKVLKIKEEVESEVENETETESWFDLWPYSRARLPFTRLVN